MSSEIKKKIELEIVHVLFIDIVGYTKLLTNQQHALVDQLNQVVRSSDQFKRAEAADRLIKIPTGDGMALIFYKSPEQPVECALEIHRALKTHPELRVRIGVHSGPVSAVIDVNGWANAAGISRALAWKQARSQKSEVRCQKFGDPELTNRCGGFAGMTTSLHQGATAWQASDDTGREGRSLQW